MLNYGIGAAVSLQCQKRESAKTIYENISRDPLVDCNYKTSKNKIMINNFFSSPKWESRKGLYILYALGALVIALQFRSIFF